MTQKTLTFAQTYGFEHGFLIILIQLRNNGDSKAIQRRFKGDSKAIQRRFKGDSKNQGMSVFSYLCQKINLLVIVCLVFIIPVFVKK